MKEEKVFSIVSFGFITSFPQAMIVRIVEGSLNGNVAIVRTMVSEVVPDKKYVVSAWFAGNILLIICCRFQHLAYVVPAWFLTGTFC